MLSNLLKHSSEGQKNPNPKHSVFEQNTTDTLSSLPSAYSTDAQMYYSQSLAFDLLHHSLSHGNVEWLEKQLSIVHKLAESSTNSQVQNKSQQYISNLDQLSEKTSNALEKISQHRKVIRQKLIAYLLLKSKQTHRKNLIRSNMFKYKSALLTIKNLKQRKLKGETQVIQLKSRLKTSGLVLVPSLIQKSIIRLALDSLSGRQCPIQITESENLRFIVDNFMGDTKIISAVCSQNEETHQLYLKFKIYILLKNRIDWKKSSHSLDKLCQEHIRGFYNLNLNMVTEIEHKKIRGLVQCDAEISRFLQNQSCSHIGFMFKSILKFIKQLQTRGPILISQLTNQVVNWNKKISSFDKLSLTGECLNSLIFQINNSLPIEEVRRVLTILDDRRYLFEMYSVSMNIKFTIKELQQLILTQSLKFIVEPVKKIMVELNKIIYKDKKQKHYHNCRLVNKSVMTWSLLVENTNSKSKQIINELENHTGIQKEVLYSPEQRRDRETTQNKGKVSIGELMTIYNQTAGQIFMYTANKLANLISSDKKLGKHQTTSHPFSLSKLNNLWIELISQGIITHLLHEAQPATVLKNLSFLQDEIIRYVDTEYTIEAQLDKLNKHILSSSKLKGKHNEDFVEQTFMKVLEINLKVRDYGKLLAICKQIKVEDQLKKMNEEIYSKIIRNIIM